MIQLTELTRLWDGGRVAALKDVSAEVNRGEFICVAGESGAGKSTLLLTLGGMLRPTSGSVAWDGVDLYSAGRSPLRLHRFENVGFVFQSFHLIPYLTVLDNVRLAARNRSSVSDTTELLAALRMEHRLHHLPSDLSVGERQRVAVARALIKGPKMILADEPTGNLDSESSGLVMDQLTEFHAAGGIVVCATHDPELLTRGSRVLRLSRGQLVSRESENEQ